MNIQKKAEENKPTRNLNKHGFQLLKGVNRCARNGCDVAETDAFLKQCNLTLILLFIRIHRFPVGRRSAHLDPFFAALGDVLVTATCHPLLDGQPLHRGDFEQDGADEGCDRIDLAVNASKVLRPRRLISRQTTLLIELALT